MKVLKAECSGTAVRPGNISLVCKRARILVRDALNVEVMYAGFGAFMVSNIIAINLLPAL